jgi:protein-S-isoprenylcysteine O-methyltransferase Ste14
MSNLFGLILVGLGVAGLAWIAVVAWTVSPKRLELRSAAFLITPGPYAFSRNPMYVSELMLWLGWATFYGSVAVLVGFAILLIVLTASVPYVRLKTSKNIEVYGRTRGDSFWRLSR